MFTSDWLGWNFEIRSATLTAEGTVGERLSRSVELDLNFLKIKKIIYEFLFHEKSILSEEIFSLEDEKMKTHFILSSIVERACFC